VPTVPMDSASIPKLKNVRSAQRAVYRVNSTAKHAIFVEMDMEKGRIPQHANPLLFQIAVVKISKTIPVHIVSLASSLILILKEDLVRHVHQLIHCAHVAK
jgi:hypothetical protein